MNKNQTGYTIFFAMMGAMCGLIAIDIAKFMDWQDATKPSFVAAVLGHFSIVIGSFFGGKLVDNSEGPR